MDTEGPHVLVCDDDRDVCDMLDEYLSRRGFVVSLANDAAAMREVIARQPVDIVVLDITMPGEDGLTALRTLRAKSDLPVLMLTVTADVVDRIVGLEMGADDYLAKPVDLRELEARLKTVLRRRVRDIAPPSSSRGQVRFGSCTLDLDTATLFDAHGVVIPISAMEFSLLKVFAENEGRVLDRDELLSLAHDRDWDPVDRSIDIRISRIRRKIEPNPTKPEIIRTVRGVGYIFGERPRTT